MSDETIALRHERSEREEYKRFMTYLNTPNQPRIRHNRRIDSRADSGANTPGIYCPRVNHEFLSRRYYKLFVIILFLFF